MLHTLLIVLAALVLGFVLYQVEPIGNIFEYDDLTGMFQISNFLILVYILYLLVKREQN